MSTELSVNQPNGAAESIIRDALKSGVSPETMRELLAVRREWEQDESRKEFQKAKHSFQSRCPIIEKADTAHNKKYARIDRIWRTIRPLMTECGLSVTWQKCVLDPSSVCRVEGKLSHVDGFEESLVFDVPIPELIPGQNRAQQVGSAHTYAQRYATCAALGIKTGDDDDDGHAAGTQFITHDQAEELADMIDACRGINGFNDSAFWKWAGATMPQEIAADRYNDVKTMLAKKMKG